MTLFAELDDGLQILEECFLKVLCYSQCNGHRHDKLLCFICVNVFSIAFLSLDQGSINIFVKGQMVNILGFIGHTVPVQLLSSAVAT